VEGPEVANHSVRREVARGQHPERHLLVQIAGNLARAEHARGVPRLCSAAKRWVSAVVLDGKFGP
jgi:hypothetical protein